MSELLAGADISGLPQRGKVVVGFSGGADSTALAHWLLGRLGPERLVLAHVTFCIPYVFLNVKSRLVGMDPALFDAARDLGASPARVVRDITLPLCRPAILSGAFLALAMSLDDFVISFFVYGAGEGTLPIKIYSSVKVGVSPQVNALCTLIMGVVFIAVALSRYLSSVRAARQRRLERQARAA